MYTIALYLHSYNRWIVLFALVWALWQAWHGLLTKREWAPQDRTAGLTLAITTSIQFILGLIVYEAPGSLARAARIDFASSMKIFELRFFMLEHPVQMIIALFLAHLGSARSKKATVTRTKFIWGTVCYTLTAVLILTAIPWWRPLLRLPQTGTTAVETQASIDLQSGDPENGKLLFMEGVDGSIPCSSCHTLTEEQLVGPGLANIGTNAGTRQPEQTAEMYLYQSIVDPAAYITSGYTNLMPNDYDQTLSETQIEDLIAYLLTLDSGNSDQE